LAIRGWQTKGKQVPEGNQEKSGLKTLSLKAAEGEQVTVVKSINIPMDFPFDISDKTFEIRYNDDMYDDSAAYDDAYPGHGGHGPSASNFYSSSANTSSNSTPGISRTSELFNTYYIYTYDGKLLAEYDHNGNCTRDYIYFGNRLIAEYKPQTNEYFYYMTDQINSTRIILNENGDLVFSEACGPYGDIQKTWTNTYNPKLKFSGKEREGYSDLDYFGARYYDHKSFRFNSVDPIINRVEALSNPQLWNLYAYCRNNPITFFDPDGRSDKDVRSIYDTYRNEVIRMTENGERHSSGKLNNIYNTFAIIFDGDEPYKNCVLQEESVRFRLIENEYDDEWTFEPVESKLFGLPIHTKGKARSKNPGDPEITYDPFKDEFCVYYSGEDRYEKFKNFSEYVKKTNQEKSGKRVKEDKNDR
jgi:RHS repeat-associated protein